MAVTIEYKEGIFYIVDGAVKTRALFPKDSQHQTAPVMMGFDYATGKFAPLSSSADGKLNVGGITIEHAEVHIGSVELQDPVNEDVRANVEGDSGKNAVYVRSNSLATAALQTTSNTKLDTINTSIHSQVDTPTSALDLKLGTINTALGHLTDATQKTQIVDGSGNVITSHSADSSRGIDVYMIGGVSLSVSISHTTESISIWGTDGAADRKLKTDAAGELQVDVLSSALPSGAATDAKLDTIIINLGMINTSVSGITTAINTQIDTKTSVLDTDIKAINTTLGTTNTSLSSIDTKLTKLSDGTQKTQIVDGGGNVIGATSNALDVNIKSGITLTVQLEHANDSVAVWGTDGTNDKQLKTDASGELQVDVLSSALPSGAATDAKLDTIITNLGTINTSITSTNTKLDSIKTDTGSIATNTGSIVTKLGDGNQKSQVIDGSNHTIASSYINANYPISLNVDDCPLGKTNIEADYTYYAAGGGVGKVETIIEYATGAGSGAWGKKTTYTYDVNGKVTKIKTENYQLP